MLTHFLPDLVPAMRVIGPDIDKVFNPKIIKISPASCQAASTEFLNAADAFISMVRLHYITII